MYVYKGNIFDADLPLSVPKPRKKYERGNDKCGTYLGYDIHRRNDERSCEPCLEAVRAYKRDWHERVRIRQGKQKRGEAQCGTNSGYVSHQRKKEVICQECKDAHNAYNRGLRAKAKAAAA